MTRLHIFTIQNYCFMQKKASKLDVSKKGVLPLNIKTLNLIDNFIEYFVNYIFLFLLSLHRDILYYCEFTVTETRVILVNLNSLKLKCSIFIKFYQCFYFLTILPTVIII